MLEELLIARAIASTSVKDAVGAAAYRDPEVAGTDEARSHARGAVEHSLKCDRSAFAAVLDGRKTHEIRFDDRDYRVGDILLLKETVHSASEMQMGAPALFTGREVRRVVAHVLAGYGLLPGWVCLSFEVRCLQHLLNPSFEPCRDPMMIPSTNQEGVPEKLLAYEVHDGDERWSICFAIHGVVARRQGAAEIGTDFEGVEHCKRAPAFDQYAPGPVPAAALIENGWTIQCSHCEREVGKNMFDALEDDGLDPADFAIVTEGQRAYCSHSCQGEHRAWFRGRAAAEAALIELFASKYPEAIIKRVHICGSKLERSEPGEGLRCLVEFLFPGAKYGATFVYGQRNVYVARGDLEAFHALYGMPEVAQREEVAA